MSFPRKTNCPLQSIFRCRTLKIGAGIYRKKSKFLSKAMMLRLFLIVCNSLSCPTMPSQAPKASASRAKGNDRRRSGRRKKGGRPAIFSRPNQKAHNFCSDIGTQVPIQPDIRTRPVFSGFLCGTHRSTFVVFPTWSECLSEALYIRKGSETHAFRRCPPFTGPGAGYSGAVQPERQRLHPDPAVAAAGHCQRQHLSPAAHPAGPRLPDPGRPGSSLPHRPHGVPHWEHLSGRSQRCGRSTPDARHRVGLPRDMPPRQPEKRGMSITSKRWRPRCAAVPSPWRAAACQPTPPA